ncbi:MAG TPA: hypothetical protein PLF25_06180 [Accumulibacter sp.]|nr:hypothetical protein [Accumulibacter sp.]
MINKLPRLRFCLLLALLLAGCFPSPEKVGELTRTSIEQRLRSDDKYRHSGAQVLAVRVTGQTGKAYDAVATISHAGKNRDIPLKIVVDGVNLEWFSGDGAFDFLVPVLPAPSASPATAARLPTVSPRVDQIPR